MSDSHEGTKARRKDKEELPEIVVDCAYHLHRELGPGLLESVYEIVLTEMLEQRGPQNFRNSLISINQA
ncbi:MAG: hypothetical protein GXP30_00905 [Verrucomicrobia bacterium]|nr:hypothetical protein [Verrucomicrobiota bacterium]